MGKLLTLPARLRSVQPTANADSPRYDSVRTALHQQHVRHALTISFGRYYIFGSALGHISTISAGALVAGTKGAVAAGTMELLIHARRSLLRNEYSLNQTLTRCINRHWTTLADAAVTRRIKQSIMHNHTGMPSHTDSSRTLRSSLITLPANARSDFIRAAIALGARHTTITPIQHVARRAIMAIAPFITTPRQAPRP